MADEARGQDVCASSPSSGCEQSSRERWNERYGRDDFRPFPATPAEWLAEHRALLELVRDSATQPRALDVACGAGRNARMLAELGFAVDAIDISEVAIATLQAAAAESGLAVRVSVVDLEHEDPPPGPYDVITATYFLQRRAFPGLQQALAPGGVLLYETFTRAHVEVLGRTFNPRFLLAPNELLRAFSDLHVRHYRETVVGSGDQARAVASIVVQRLP